MAWDYGRDPLCKVLTTESSGGPSCSCHWETAVTFLYGIIWAGGGETVFGEQGEARIATTTNTF